MSMSSFYRGLFFLSLFQSWVLLPRAHGSETVCAQVQIRIVQKLTMERQGFEATLQVANGLPSTALTHFNVTLKFSDSNGNPISSGSDSQAIGLTFWYGPQSGSPVALDATIEGGGIRTFKWLIVPTVGAAQSSIQGTTYLIGATVSYAVNGIVQSMQVDPDYVQVYPTPILDLEYFLPEQVIGQDPNTPNMFLAPIPFSLGVRVKNSGWGSAKGLKIDSGQPQIVRNDTGLAISFKIIGSEVQGKPSSPSLLVNFGDLPGNGVAVGSWEMESSLTGKFTSFTASFNHTDALGGAATSLIRSVSTFRLLGEVLQPYSNGSLCFLGYPEGNRDDLFLFPSNSQERIPVNKVVGSLLLSGSVALFNLGATGYSGLIFSQIEHSNLKGLIVTSVTRSDGILLPPQNAWVSATQDIDGSFKWHYYLNLFDSIPGVSAINYTIQLSAPITGNHSPVIQAMPDHYLKVSSGISCNYLVRASDQDGDSIVLASSGLPAGATFNPLYVGPGVGAGAGQATGLFSWVPSAQDVGDYTVRFTASDGQETSAQSMGIHIVSGSTSQFAAWREKYWPGVSDLGIIGDAANPARDGYPNLMKYALGVDPTKAEGTLTQIGTVQVDGTSYLTLSYLRRTDDPSLSFCIQASNHLFKDADWSDLDDIDLSADQTNLPSGFERVTKRDSQSLSEPSAPRRYLRLKVNTVFGPPAGYCRIPVAGHGSTVIGVPLLRNAVVAGRVTASGSNQVTMSDVMWTQNQFVSTDQPYYLEVVTGNLAGCFFPIIANTVDTLILESPDLTLHPLGSLMVDSFFSGIDPSGIGDLVRIRQAWTLGVLLGNSGSMGAINPGNSLGESETISIPDNDRIGIYKTPLLSVFNGNARGWLDRIGNDYTNRAIWPGTALIVHRFGNSTGQDWIVVGEVQSAPFVGCIPRIPSLSNPAALSGTESLANDFYFAPVIADFVGVVDSGLSALFQVSNSALDRGDELDFFDAGISGFFNPEPSRIFYFSSGQWQEVGVSGSSSLQFEPGKGYRFRIKAGNQGGYWRVIQN